MSPDPLQSLIAQTYLRGLGYYHGKLDGDWGPVSRQAAVNWSKSPGFVTMGDATYLRALAAQRLLGKLNLYRGAQDGIWGPISKAAASKWEAWQKPEANPLPVEPDPRWSLPFDIAKTYLGTKEIPGKANNPLIVRWHRRLLSWISDDETAWCSSFANFCAAEAGYESSGKVNARSWLEVGEPVTLANVRKGDVVILWRGRKDGWEGHVAFLDHYNSVRELLYLLGGNQNNEVNITAYSTAQLLGIRRLRSLDRLQGNTGNLII